MDATLNKVDRVDRFDRPLVLVTAALIAFGIIMVYSASAVISEQAYHTTYHYLVKHLVALAMGTAAGITLATIDYRRLRHPAFVYGFLGVILLLLVAVLFMPAVRGSHRWFRLGSFAVQPSEFAKLAMIVFCAYMLEKKAARVNDFVHTLAPMLVIMATIVATVLVQPDLGTAVSLVAIVGFMLFVAGLSWGYLAAGVALAVPLVIKLILDEPYRLARLMAFLYPWKDPLGSGFQPIQSLIALGSGGVMGLGPAASRQKLFFLPEPHTDFIYAVIGEEYGFIGCALVLAAFVVFMMRGIKITLAAREPFGFYLGMGVTAMIMYQVLVNVSVVLAIMPTKGTPLPFLSAGGSSLIVCMAGVGLLANLSRRR